MASKTQTSQEEELTNVVETSPLSREEKITQEIQFHFNDFKDEPFLWVVDKGESYETYLSAHKNFADLASQNGKYQIYQIFR
jgi:hypothetical protein